VTAESQEVFMLPPDAVLQAREILAAVGWDPEEVFLVALKVSLAATTLIQCQADYERR
jgi:hypothetical protein